MEEQGPYVLALSPHFERVLKSLKRKNPTVLRELENHIAKILREPTLGKPLRHALRNYRRVHVGGSFVLLYEIATKEVRLLDFDHHDRIYKKH